MKLKDIKPKITVTHGSLFSGIGGFDLAAEWMGWENEFHCEWNTFGQRILKYYWPNAKTYTDITKSDFSLHRGRIDVLTGGFPCQPFSAAGKQEGTNDNRYLWPEMLRAIREVQPSWVVGENVRGLVNWSGGLVFEQVQIDLEAEGYEVQPFILPACAVNAPHRRDRIWFVAYSGGNGCERPQNLEKVNDQRIRERLAKGHEFDAQSDARLAPNSQRKRTTESTRGFHESRELLQKAEREENQQQHKSSGSGRTITNTSRQGSQSNPRREFESISEEAGKFKGDSSPGNHSAAEWWEVWPTQSPICSGDDGLPTELDGITISKHRRESIKAYGNAIVPQVALQIFQSIQEYENLQ